MSCLFFVLIKCDVFVTDNCNVYNIIVQFSYISKREKENNVELFNYLHIVMHCIFRHMYKDPALNRRPWDLACDIAVEYMIAESGCVLHL